MAKFSKYWVGSKTSGYWKAGYSPEQLEKIRKKARKLGYKQEKERQKLFKYRPK